MNHHITRNPQGVVKDKPIALRLMPDELAEAQQVAEKAGCSKSSLARAAYLRGLPLVVAALSHPTSTGLCGGEGPEPSPAALSRKG